MEVTGNYVVVIPYREPTRELRRGNAPLEPYHATYEVQAASPEEAVDRAIEEFEAAERASNAGWAREIQREQIRVEPAS